MTVGLHLFIQEAIDDPVYFTQVVVTVLVSVTLHELGHAAAAIWQGDDTPRLAGRLTLNPFAHMGWLSIVMLLVVGIAWGSTPVDPRRFRSRHGDALVSLAGPAVNVLLALLGLTAFAVWSRWGAAPTPILENLRGFFLVFGLVNVLLCLFNLLPIPPLDGSHIVADFVPAYRKLIRDPNNQGAITVLFIAVFLGAPHLWSFSEEIAAQYLLLWFR